MALLDGQTDVGADDAAARAAITEGRGEAPPPADDIPPPPEPGKSVTLTPPKPRRARIEEEYSAKLKEVSDNLLRMNEGMSARDRQIGELTGHIQALSQRERQYVPPHYQQAPAPQLPDPDELRRKAIERLDAKDMDGYHRFLSESHTAATLRAVQPLLAQQAQRAAPQQSEQIPPALMPFFAAYPDVASHPNMMQLLASKNVELDARGFPQGPGRVKQIFEEVRGILNAGRQQQGGAPAYSQQAAAVLSGVPTARPSNGSGARNGEPRVELTVEERTIAKKVGMDEARYAASIAKHNPERIIRG